MTSPREAADRVNAAVAAFRATPEGQATERFLAARDEMHAAGRALGLDPEAIADAHASLRLRVDAFLERSRRTLRDLDTLARWAERLA